jgi:hypothetical protein
MNHNDDNNMDVTGDMTGRRSVAAGFPIAASPSVQASLRAPAQRPSVSASSTSGVGEKTRISDSSVSPAGGESFVMGAASREQSSRHLIRTPPLPRPSRPAPFCPPTCMNGGQSLEVGETPRPSPALQVPPPILPPHYVPTHLRTSPVAGAGTGRGVPAPGGRLGGGGSLATQTTPPAPEAGGQGGENR